MAKVVQPLTNTQIANAKATDNDKSLYDGDGLFLLIKSSGVKIWRFRYYKPIDKKRTTLTFGNYPALGLADARRMRESALSLLAQGIDPQKYKQEQIQQKLEKENNTFQKVAEDWFKIESKKKFTQDTLKRKWNSLQNHVLNYIGNEPITAITAQQLIKTLQPLNEKII